MSPKNKNDNDDYPIDFKGAKLTQLEANRLGVGILCGILGIVLLFFLPIEAKSPLSYFVLVLFFVIGYFVISSLIFRKK